MRFGLALSGGALRGVAHIGVLRALMEGGLFPSWISGTSAGSIIAALYACGYTPLQMEQIALSIERNIFDIDYSGIALSSVQWLLTRQLCLSGIVKGRRLERLMKELLGERTLRETKIPLAVTAVNINNGQTVLFLSSKSGLTDTRHKVFIDDVPVYQAVRASIAIPMVFQPAFIKGMRLVDGGVNDNLPITALRMMGAKAVVGINLGYSGQMRHEVSNLLEIGNQTIDIMAYQITRLRNQDADLILNPTIYDVGMTDIHRIPECIRRGYEMTLAHLDLIKKLIKN